MSDVFDLDAAEVADDLTPAKEPFRFKVGGELFEIPNPPPFAAMAVYQAEGEENIGKLVQALIGVDGFNRLMKVSPSYAQIKLIFEKYSDFMGVDLGKSSPLAKRSKNTAKR